MVNDIYENADLQLEELPTFGLCYVISADDCEKEMTVAK